jgi:cold-inducible RNA-binding protein
VIKGYLLIKGSIVDQLVTLIVDNKLFIGSLPWSTDEAELTELFSAYGEVTSARVITDRETGRSRGFGFVEYADEETAAKAMEAADGSMVDGRNITVSIAREKTE